MLPTDSFRWSDVDLQSRDVFQSHLQASILRGEPLLAGKIGANELNVLYWLERLPIPERSFPFRRLHLWNLRSCETNAGLKPRTRESYRDYAHLLRQAAIEADHLGVWHQPAELQLYRRLALKARYYDLFDLCPWFAQPAHAWSTALAGKRLFVVSPFLASIRDQYQKRDLIWQSRPGIFPACHLSGYQFPYLISRACSLSWRQVYDDVCAVMQSTEFDVALLGCGALGLPLGMEAKRLGRQALHMGGFLQVLFGIHGGRFRRDPAYADLINKHWIAPSAEETPPESAAVEEGCYW